MDFDYCIVTVLNLDIIKKEALILEIPINKLIPINVLQVPYFDFKKYIHIKETGISILSQNCWGGLCYNHLGYD